MILHKPTQTGHQIRRKRTRSRKITSSGCSRRRTTETPSRLPRSAGVCKPKTDAAVFFCITNHSDNPLWPSKPRVDSCFLESSFQQIIRDAVDGGITQKMHFLFLSPLLWCKRLCYGVCGRLKDESAVCLLLQIRKGFFVGLLLQRNDWECEYSEIFRQSGENWRSSFWFKYLITNGCFWFSLEWRSTLIKS